MADPFGIIGAAAVAAHAVHQAKIFTGNVVGAPRRIELLHDDLESIANLLFQIDGFLRRLATAHTTQEAFLAQIEKALSSCAKVALEAEVLLKPFIKQRGATTPSKWKRIAWGFKESKAVDLQRDMATCKQTL